jgi:thiol-disulfide isomerase/thioredoxin
VSTGAWFVVAAVLVALALGCYRLLTDGRFRRTPEADPTPWAHVLDAVPGAALGERATLLQFSSAFCAPCRATRRTLADVADVVPGVVHLEVDAERHLDLVRRLSIVRTPTTLVLDGAGREVTRASGAPRKEQVLSALAGA